MELEVAIAKEHIITELDIKLELKARINMNY